MAVGCLHDVVIRPMGGGVTELEQLRLVGGEIGRVCLTLQHPVDNRRHLGAGDGLVRPEGAAGIAADPAQLIGAVDIDLRPVPLGIIERIVQGIGVGEEPGCDGGKLPAGDGALGRKVPSP